MTEYMIDSITVDRNKIYQGSGRLVVSDPAVLTSFPGVLESVMNGASPVTGSAYALASGWIDLGPTTEDGITLSREAELSEGIALDQRKTNLSEGEPDKWSMGLETTLLHTTLENIQKAWQGSSLRSINASASNVAQRSLSLDAPPSFTERMLALIQEDPVSGNLRAFVFRKAKPKVDGSEINAQKNEASGLPVSFTLNADTAIADGYGQFGMIFEEGNV